MIFLTELLSESFKTDSTGSGSGTENLNQSYSYALRPLLDCTDTHHTTKRLSGMYNVQDKRKQLKLADCTITGATHIGTKELRTSGKEISLSDVMCAPSIDQDLVSVPMIARNHFVIFCKHRP